MPNQTTNFGRPTTPPSSLEKALAALDTMATVWAAGFDIRASVKDMIASPDGDDRLIAFIKQAHCEGLYAGRMSHRVGVEAVPADSITDVLAIDHDEHRVVWPKSRDTGRMGDMTPARQSVLRVGLDSDNDVFVSMWDNGRGPDDFQRVSIEFCNGGSGGGRSPRTRAALINLMTAIEADNTEFPDKAWPYAGDTTAGRDA